jgi:formylglycine-generating enzyme required for sulfatase activity
MTRWSFGDDAGLLGEYAWYRDNTWDIGKEYAHAVGQKRPNPWGLYDMHGNVLEWCQDWVDFFYPSGRQTDPTGPSTGVHRVKRGGGFSALALGTRSAIRNYGAPDSRRYSLGARLLRMR